MSSSYPTSAGTPFPMSARIRRSRRPLARVAQIRLRSGRDSRWWVSRTLRPCVADRTPRAGCRVDSSRGGRPREFAADARCSDRSRSELASCGVGPACLVPEREARRGPARTLGYSPNSSSRQPGRIGARGCPHPSRGAVGRTGRRQQPRSRSALVQRVLERRRDGAALSRVTREEFMTTGDIVRERALELARSLADRNLAVDELLETCGGRRVAAVRARQQLVTRLDSEPDQQDAKRAIEFLDDLLARLPA